MTLTNRKLLTNKQKKINLTSRSNNKKNKKKGEK